MKKSKTGSNQQQISIAPYDDSSYILSMKVTTLIPDDLLAEVRELSGGKNLTESLIKALREWTSLQRLRKVKAKVRAKPLEFTESFSADRIRETNRLK